MDDTELFPAFDGVIPHDLDFRQGGTLMPGIGSAPVGGIPGGGKKVILDNSPTDKNGLDPRLGKEPIKDPNELAKAIDKWASTVREKQQKVIDWGQIGMCGTGKIMFKNAR